MLDPDIAETVREAAERVITGRESIPSDLPYPPSVGQYLLHTMWPDEDPGRAALTKDGRRLSRATMRVYLAGYRAGRECDEQIGNQVRQALGIDWATAASTYHPYIGVAVCLVCDQASDHPVHEEAGAAVTGPSAGGGA